MKLRRTISVWGLILSLLLLLGNTLFSTYIVEDGFLALERRHVLDKLSATVNGLDACVDQLDLFALDWSNWDDTYAYTQDRNALYAESNLGTTTFTDQDLTAIIIRDRAGSIVFARAVDADAVDAPKLLTDILRTLDAQPLPPQEDHNSKGLLSLDNAIYMFSIHPVLTSDGEGPAMGSLAMVKRLSEDVAHAVGDAVGCAVRVAPIEAEEDLARRIENSQARETVFNIDRETAVGARLFPTLNDKDAWLVAVRTDRDITLFGSTVATYNALALAASILLLAATTYVLLHIKFVRRLERIKTQITAMKEPSPNGQHVEVDGDDEIADLASSLNTLLDGLRESHRQQAEQGAKIADNERFLNQIFNSISVGLLLIEPVSRQILDINDFALKMADRKREEVVGKVCHRLTCPAEINDCPILDRHQAQDLSRRKMLARDGTEIPIMKFASYITRNERPLLLETIIDITDMENARLELERVKEGLEETVEARTRELQDANRELVALDKAKTLFLSSASHELRTPLTSILGFLMLLEKNFKKHFHSPLPDTDALKPKADKLVQNFGIVRREAERLGRLVNDLLDLNKIESGRMEWRDQPLDVQEILTSAAEAYSGYSGNHDGVELLVEQPADALTIHADRDRVQQVLINLLNNAFKFTESGHVKLSATPSGEFVRFEVSDTGKGIAEPDIKQIFDLFYQVHDENRRSSKEFGTGLGLAISRQIVSHYGGDISVESIEGEGSTFAFTIPAS